jgi:hypothetical protein
MHDIKCIWICKATVQTRSPQLTNMSSASGYLPPQQMSWILLTDASLVYFGLVSPHEVPETPNLGLGGHECSHCIFQGKTLSPVNMGSDSEQCVEDRWNKLARKLEVTFPFGYSCKTWGYQDVSLHTKCGRQNTEISYWKKPNIFKSVLAGKGGRA